MPLAVNGFGHLRRAEEVSPGTLFLLDGHSVHGGAKHLCLAAEEEDRKWVVLLAVTAGPDRSVMPTLARWDEIVPDWVQELDGEVRIEPTSPLAILGPQNHPTNGSLVLHSDGSVALMLSRRNGAIALVDVSSGRFVSQQEGSPVFNDWRIVRVGRHEDVGLMQFCRGVSRSEVAA